MFGEGNVYSLCFKYVGMEKGRREWEKHKMMALQWDLSGYVERCLCLFFSFVSRFGMDLYVR